MNLRFFLVSFLTLFIFQVSAQQSVEEYLKQLMQKANCKNASMGIHVVDINQKKTVFGINSERVLIPASTMKLVTSASAIEMLGENYTFKTLIGYKGKGQSDGELEGDLVLIGGADPVLGSEYFQGYYFDFLRHWAQEIKAAGISQVKGNLVLDASIYDTEKIPDTWIWGDIGNYYGAGANAFTVYDNLFRITFQSPAEVGTLTQITRIKPEIEGMTFVNEVVSANHNSDKAYVFGGPFDKNRVIRGSIPRSRNAFTIKAAIHHPKAILAREFINILAKEGVFISGNISFSTVNRKEFQTVFVQESPKLKEIAKILNHESVNLFAEHFLKQISVEKEDVGNSDKSINLLKKYWEKKGISTKYLFMEDGSGLSHFNAVSPRFFTELLVYMCSNEAFINSLPTAGNGTLHWFDKTLFKDESLRAKSGSMTRVRCYAGYLHTDSGKKLAFSVMFNHFSGSHSALIREIEQLLLIMKTTL